MKSSISDDYRHLIHCTSISTTSPIQQTPQTNTSKIRPSNRPHSLPLQQAPRPPLGLGLPRPAHRRKAAQHAHHPLRRNPKVLQRNRPARRGAGQRGDESQLRRHVCSQRVRELLTTTEGLERGGDGALGEAEGCEGGEYEEEG